MTEKIPVWAMRLILMVSLSISGAALFLTRAYAVGNLAVLGLDADTIFVRRLSIDVLLAAHVAALFIAMVLPDRYFRLKRWQLYALALAIWAFDGASIYQARFGVMDKADTEQAAAVARLADQRAAIKTLQDQAAAQRATAARLMNNRKITAGGEAQAEAARLTAKAAAMSEQLVAMPSGAGTTEVRVWGWRAPYKAAIESALISFVSLVMLGLAGMSARELLQASAARRPALAAAPAAPAPVATPPAPVAPAKPAPARTEAEVRYSTRLAKSLGLGLGAAAVAVPAARAAEPAYSAPAPAMPAPVAPVAPAPVAPKQVDPSTPQQVQQVRVSLEKKVRQPQARKPAPAGARADTGVVGDVAGRYTRLKAAVQAGRCAPSQGGVRKFLAGAGEGCNLETADKYLAQLGKEDVIERNPSGRGWKRKGAA